MQGKRQKSQTEKFSDSKRLTYVAIAIIAILVMAGFFFYIYPNQPSQPKAAIIDQLASSQLAQPIRHPNQTFVETAETLLYERFSEVDYYSDNATVEQYKRLSSSDYKLIVWRAHSALDLSSKYIAISTSEKYGAIDYDEYLEGGQLTLCNITGDPNLYFGITPKFVDEVMSGRFEGTVIILMSCNGLNESYTKTAEAFREKDAEAFISWDGWIDAYDNDQAITLLLDYLIDKNNTISEAVRKIPVYPSIRGPSELHYYPLNPEAADYRIPDYKQRSIASNTGFATITIRKNIRIKRSLTKLTC